MLEAPLAAAAPVTSSELTTIATGLSGLGLAVVVAAGRAFPGWGTDWLSKISRALVLVLTTAFATLAAVAANVLIGAITTDTPASRGDVAFFQNLLGFGAVVLGLLFLVALFAPDTAIERRALPAIDALIVTAIAICIGLRAAQSTIELLDRPASAAILLSVLVVVFVLAEEGLDHLARRQERRRVSEEHAAVIQVLEGPDRVGQFALIGCGLQIARTGHELCRGWTLAGAGIRSHVWLELPAAQTLAGRFSDRLLADDPAARRLRLTLRTRRYVGLRTLELDDITSPDSPTSFTELPVPDRGRARSGVFVLPTPVIRDLGLVISADQ